MPRSPSRIRRFGGLALLAAAIFVAADQLLLHTLLASDRLGERYVAPFDPPLFTTDQRARLEEYRALVREGSGRSGSSAFDAELGWCPRPGRPSTTIAYDELGCRVGVAPLEPSRVPGVRRIVVVGCSFTHGDEVRGEETWAAMLDESRADLEVANLGVGGYGLDQALLRLRRDGTMLEPDEVWLGLLPSAGLRVVTCFTPACQHWTGIVRFKPRFVLDLAGELRLLPSPAHDLAGVLRLLADQRAFLAAVGDSDAWVRRAPLAYAPRGSSLLHHSAVGRLALTAHEACGRDLEAAMIDGRSEVHTVTRAIVRAAHEETEAVGARFRLLVLPSRADLLPLATGEEPYWSALVASLRADGVEVRDLSDALLAAGVLHDEACWAPQGHYSPRTNAIVAGALSELVVRESPAEEER